MATAMRPARETSGDAGKVSAGLSRNLIIQLVGLVCIGLALAHVLPWVWIAPWMLGVVGSSWIEDTLLRRAPDAGPAGRGLRGAAAGFRVLSSGLWAFGALALIARGDAAERMLAFALLAVSMVNVLMRYYHSRLVFLMGVAPHLLVLSLIAWGLTAKALASGSLVTAFTPFAVVVMFGVLFWACRAQLAESWMALAKATAEAREGKPRGRSLLRASGWCRRASCVGHRAANAQRSRRVRPSRPGSASSRPCARPCGWR